jgi:small subunit ribosomal protein S20
MPNTKSASKHLRTDAKRTLRNRIRKSLIKTTEKKYLAKIEVKDTEGAKLALVECFSALDKAAKAGTIHRNKANRKKSRLNALLQGV